MNYRKFAIAAGIAFSVLVASTPSIAGYDVARDALTQGYTRTELERK